MADYILLIGIIFLAFEVFFVAATTGYFQQKLNIQVILRVLFMWFLCEFAVWFGTKSGAFSKSIFEAQAHWYSATLYLAMALKYLYGAFRLRNAKNTINPLDNKGLTILLFGLLMNGFFLGLAGGLYAGSLSPILITLPTLLFPIVGLIFGVKMNKLLNFRYEFVFAVLLLITAFTILKNP